MSRGCDLSMQETNFEVVLVISKHQRIGPILIILPLEHRSDQESCVAVEPVDSGCGLKLPLIFPRSAILVPLVNQRTGTWRRVDGDVSRSHRGRQTSRFCSCP